MKKWLGIMFGLILLAAGAFAQSNIGGVRWQLIEIDGKRVSNSRTYIEFDQPQERLSGFSGCNLFNGGYELADDNFKVEGVVSTRMACMRPGVMEAEQQFLKALTEATRLKRNGDNLSLFKEKNRVLRFRTVTKPDESGSSELGSRKWLLRSIGGAPVSLARNTPHLTFDLAKGEVGGNGSCNGFGGSFEIDGSTIKFGQLISTMMACEAENKMTIERGFLDGLQNADRFEIKSNKLFIYQGERILLELEGVAK